LRSAHDGGRRDTRKHPAVPRITDQALPPKRAPKKRRGSIVRGSAGTPDLRTVTHRRSAYLTDGRRLFRNVNPLRGTIGRGLVALEDCRTLQLVLMPVREFVRLRDVSAT
jgi:hypothetical protein